MPLDDLIDELEDLFEEVGEWFEDGLLALLMGKKARKRLGRFTERFGESIAIAALGATAYRRWDHDAEDQDDDDDRDREKQKKRKKKDRDRKKKKRKSSRKEEKETSEEDEGDREPASRLEGEIETCARSISVTECLKVNMLLAMISAAGADGKIDGDELSRLLDSIEGAAISASDKALLTRLINQPPPLEEVAAGAHSPLEACELYGAALSAIENDTPAETLFLRRFARALELDDDIVATIHGTLDSGWNAEQSPVLLKQESYAEGSSRSGLESAS